MNFFRSIWLLLIGFAVFSCNSGPSCENNDIEKFDSFLGLDANTREGELKEKLGEFTGGFYSDDNTQFIYNFFAVPDAPISVVVNATSTNVETVVMEVLTYEDSFKKDLDAVSKAYQLDECDTRFFGMQKDELIEALGQPAEDTMLEGQVTSLTYFSKDFKTKINFKCYPEQNNMCSSVIVNWFH